jgi:hypothetical protein
MENNRYREEEKELNENVEEPIKEDVREEKEEAVQEEPVKGSKKSKQRIKITRKKSYRIESSKRNCITT